MKKNIKIQVAFIGLTVLLLVIYDLYTNKSQSNSKPFKESFKEIVKKDESILDHYDSVSRIYSNYYYGFSMIFPYEWEMNKGFSKHTVIKYTQADSALTFSINVIELNTTDDETSSIWAVYNKDKKLSDQFYLEGIEKMLNTKVYNLRTSLIFFSNHECIVREFTFVERNYDDEYEMKSIYYQLFRGNKIFTIGLQAPLMFYEINPIRYQKLFDGFYFGI